MNITNALTALGVDDTTLSEKEKDDMEKNGFVVLPNLIEAEWLEQLRQRFEELCEEEGEHALQEGHCRLSYGESSRRGQGAEGQV